MISRRQERCYFVGLVVRSRWLSRTGRLKAACAAGVVVPWRDIATHNSPRAVATRVAPSHFAPRRVRPPPPHSLRVKESKCSERSRAEAGYSEQWSTHISHLCRSHPSDAPTYGALYLLQGNQPPAVMIRGGGCVVTVIPRFVSGRLLKVLSPWIPT